MLIRQICLLSDFFSEHLNAHLHCKLCFCWHLLELVQIANSGFKKREGDDIMIENWVGLLWYGGDTPVIREPSHRWWEWKWGLIVLLSTV